MCGINGFNFSDEKLIKLMNVAIKHRGPDGNGVYIDEKISFGQVRLSILDLSDAGHQPMFYSKKFGGSNEKFNLENIKKSDYSIVFNGEIYNYIEVRDELLKEGYKFTTQGDTEVILAAYDAWGENCVKKFNGMWAFAIHDKKKDILFCSRDRLGVKPFYYYFKEGQFIFSSELKGILEHKKLKLNRRENINNIAIEFYFSTGFIPSPMTIYADCFKLEAGCNLEFNLKSSKKTITRYYEIPDFAPINKKKNLIREGRELLKDSVKLRMRSDVAVGAFLSGGLDSSAVVGTMKDFTSLEKLHTFSVGFSEKIYDETPYIKTVKNYFHTKHQHQIFKENDFVNLIKDFSEVYDEPFWDYSGFPTMKISEVAKKNVTVVLSGDGGDEIFAGYNSHLAGARMDVIRKFPRSFRYIFSKIPAKKNLDGFISLYTFKEAMKLSLRKPESFYSNALSEDKYLAESFKKWSEEKLKFSIKKGGGKLSEGLRIYDLRFNTLSDNFLVKVDRASMKYAIEVRSPFLDYRFIEFAQRIPSQYKVNSRKTKILMREIISEILPSSIVNRGKQGFNPPINIWIQKNEYFEYLNKNLEELYLNSVIGEDIYLFYKNKVFKNNNSLYIEYRIKLFLFCNWYEKWVKK